MKSVFLSYSHKDENIREELATHMHSLIRSNLISTWSDKMIVPGQDWEQEIIHNIETADIILLLVSADFIKSDYCFDKEVKLAVKRTEQNDAILVPIIARTCNWKDTPFAKFQVLPTGAKPINSWSDKDEAYTDIVIGLKKLIKASKVKEKNKTPSPNPVKTSSAGMEILKNISEIAKNLTASNDSVSRTSKPKQLSKLDGHEPQNIFGKWQLVELKQNNHNLTIPMLEESVFYSNMTFQLFQNKVQTNYGHFNFNGTNLNLILFNGMTDPRSFYCKSNQLILHQKAYNIFAFYQRIN